MSDLNEPIRSQDARGSIFGAVAPGFEGVAAAFADNFEHGRELGAACAIYLDGAPVLDLWGGHARTAPDSAWGQDTIVPVFSVSKGISAVCVLSLADQGAFRLDEPLAKYWPEFAAHGKGRVSIREALGHRAGVPFIDGSVTLDDLGDLEGMGARIAAQPPCFEPGSAHLYHGWTVGWIANGLVRRTAGCSMPEWLRQNAAEPLGIDLWMGLPDRERARVATIVAADPQAAISFLPPADSPIGRSTSMNGAISVLPGGPGADINDPRLQAIALPAGNVVTNARALAKFYAACLAPMDGVRLVSDEMIADGSRCVSSGAMWGTDWPGGSWGAGLMRPAAHQPMLGPQSFGHDGFGGSLAFADPSSRVSFGYVRNRLPVSTTKDAAVYSVVDALAAALKASR